MPLLKRKHWELVPGPENLPPGAEVWQIRFTGEIFTNYQEYAQRLHMYTSRFWSCESTSKSGMTYEEALKSESMARKKSAEKFPPMWKLPALKMLHYSTITLLDHVDNMFLHFKHNIYIGEIVYVYFKIIDDLRIAKVMKEVQNPDDEPKAVNAIDPTYNDDDDDDGGEQRSTKKKKGPAPERPPDRYFVVHLCENNGQLYQPDPAYDEDDPNNMFLYVVLNHQIKRDRQVLSKSNLKKFIKENAVKDAWMGAPWVVKSDLVKRYNLASEPPRDIVELLEQRASKGGKVVKGEVVMDLMGKSRTMSKSHKSKQVVFPMEDIDLWTVSPRWFEPGESIPCRPVPSSDFFGIPQDLMCSVLVVWDFLVVFGHRIHFYPANFEDFCRSVVHRSKPDSCVLLQEAFGALVTAACAEWSKRVKDGSVTAVSGVPGESVGEYPDSQNISMQREQFGALYSTLSDDEQSTIEQWWLWFPGCWDNGLDRVGVASGRTTKKGSAGPTAPSGGGTDVPSVKRLKMWEVALLGLIKDWAEPWRLPSKWRIATILATGNLPNSQNDQMGVVEDFNGLAAIETDEVVTEQSSSAGTPEPTEVPPQESNYSSSHNGKGPKKRQNESPTEQAYDQVNGRRVSGRAASRKATTALHNYAETESTGSEHPIGNGYELRKKRKMADGTLVYVDELGQETLVLPEGMMGGDDSVNTDPMDDEVVGIDTTPPKPVVSNRKKGGESSISVGGNKSRSAPSLSVEELCARAACGFEMLGVRDRVELLRFLVDECVLHTDNMREQMEQGTEKIVELKREKREIGRERKQIAQELMELDRRARLEEYHAQLNGSRSGSVSDGQEEEAGSAHRTTSRVQKLKEDKRKKEELERQKEEQKGTQKDSKPKVEDKRKLEDRERALARREAVIDQELAANSSSSRIKPIGLDRYHNRYWWFDSSFGVTFTPPDEPGPTRRSLQHQVQQISTPGVSAAGSVLDWASGRLFVEDVWAVPPEDPNRKNMNSSQPDEERMMGLTEGVWGYYAEPEQIDQLLEWLDIRGVRESNLHAAITNTIYPIATAMRRRSDDIAAARTKHEVLQISGGRARKRNTSLHVQELEENVDATEVDVVDPVRPPLALVWYPYMDYVNHFAVNMGKSK
ncbi:hypothetical protein BJ742DRAFT_772877 [Cladochytrium replicatum]|nr:hypothetical protein BJ742DRAFT_772877 [Cladochytrium replicatum]